MIPEWLSESGLARSDKQESSKLSDLDELVGCQQALDIERDEALEHAEQLAKQLVESEEQAYLGVIAESQVTALRQRADVARREYVQRKVAADKNRDRCAALRTEIERRKRRVSEIISLRGRMADGGSQVSKLLGDARDMCIHLCSLERQLESICGPVDASQFLYLDGNIIHDVDAWREEVRARANRLHARDFATVLRWRDSDESGISDYDSLAERIQTLIDALPYEGGAD